MMSFDYYILEDKFGNNLQRIFKIIESEELLNHDAQNL